MKDKIYLDDELVIRDDDSIYSDDVREQLLEDDELSPLEAAFMDGYAGNTEKWGGCRTWRFGWTPWLHAISPCGLC